MESSWIRLEGILPPNSTYVLTRAASDLALQNCADMVEPDEFLKHNGDDGFKITHIGYLPESLSEDTTAWLKMSLTLDAIGYANNDPGSAWDVSGVSEATRYYILSRNMDVCGGNGGDWDASRGCVNDACDSTRSDLGEWTHSHARLVLLRVICLRVLMLLQMLLYFVETIIISVHRFQLQKRLFRRKLG